jgi:hypothetical protein
LLSECSLCFAHFDFQTVRVRTGLGQGDITGHDFVPWVVASYLTKPHGPMAEIVNQVIAIANQAS